MQLAIEVEVTNQNGYNEAKKKYEASKLPNTYLVTNITDGTYFVSYFFSKETIEKYSNFKIVM